MRKDTTKSASKRKKGEIPPTKSGRKEPKPKPDIRIMLASGYTNEKSHRQEIRKRGFSFLQKPYSLDDLLLSIEEVLEQHRKEVRYDL